MEYQLKVYDHDGECVDEITGFESCTEAEQEGWAILRADDGDRVEIFTDRFRTRVAVH